MNHEWGTWSDIDTELGLKKYEEAGLQLSTPHDIQALNTQERQKVARACSALLEHVYKGNYPRIIADAQTLDASISEGVLNLFTLSCDEELVAMGGLTRHATQLGGAIHLAELGKLAKSQDNKVIRGISARYLSKFRLPWTFKNMPEIDFIQCSPRAAADGVEGVPGGKSAQSIWWGGRRYGPPFPLLASSVGWNFKIGNIEPQSRFIAPARANVWADVVGQSRALCVPSKRIQHQLTTLFTEGTNGKIRLPIEVDTTNNQEPFTVREFFSPSANVGARYYLTRQTSNLAERTLPELNEQLPDTISQNVIIESDVATTAQGAATMRHLLAQGWMPAGWQPSHVTYGGICPVFTRVNPWQLAKLTMPKHYPQYFDEGGLAETRQVLDAMYQAIYESAARKASHMPAKV